MMNKQWIQSYSEEDSAVSIEHQKDSPLEDTAAHEHTILFVIYSSPQAVFFTKYV